MRWTWGLAALAFLGCEPGEKIDVEKARWRVLSASAALAVIERPSSNWVRWPALSMDAASWEFDDARGRCPDLFFIPPERAPLPEGSDAGADAGVSDDDSPPVPRVMFEALALTSTPAPTYIEVSAGEGDGELLATVRQFAGENRSGWRRVCHQGGCSELYAVEVEFTIPDPPTVDEVGEVGRIDPCVGTP